MNHSILKNNLFHFLLIFFLISTLLFSFAKAESGVPSVLSYQGRLTDLSGNLLGNTGTPFFFKFSFWDSATVGAGSQVWPVVNPSSVSLTVKQGVFNVNLGDTENGYPDILNYNFNTNKKIYLQIEVSSNNSSFETLSPRQRITSSAFAELAGQVNGVGQSSFGTTTPIDNSIVTIESTSSASTALTLLASAGQLSNIFNIFDSNNNSIFSINNSGGLLANYATTTNFFSNYLNSINSNSKNSTSTNLFASNFKLSNLNGLLFGDNGVISSVSTSSIFSNYYDKVQSDGLYDLLGSATSSITNHENIFNHNLIATALQSFTESDPLFMSASTSLSYIPLSASTSLNYIKTESDPFYTSSSWSTTTNNSTNWNTAFGWGSHNGLYDLLGAASTTASSTLLNWLVLNPTSGTNTGDNATNTQYSGLVNSKQNTLNGTGFVKASGTSITYDNNTYLTAETDPLFTAWDKHAGISITESQIFDLKSYLTAESDTLATITARSASTSVKSTFSGGLITNKIHPVTDSSTAIQITKADGTTSVFNIDTTNGNVGIGTTGPGAKLEVYSSTGGASSGILVKADSGYASMDYKVTGSGTGLQTGLYQSGEAFFYNSDGGMTFYTDPTLGGSGGTARLAILGSGNVGIGTTNPGRKLDVQGAIQIGMDGTDSLIDMPSNSWGDKWYFAGSGIKMAMDETSTSWLTTFGGSTGLTKFRWSSTKAGGINGPILDLETGGNAIFYGNVGIGTTSPSVKLSVKGLGTGTGVLFRTAGSTDSPGLTVLDKGWIGNRFALPVALFQSDTQLDGQYADDGTKPTWRLSYSGTPVIDLSMGNSYQAMISNPYSGGSIGGLQFRTGGLGTAFTRMTIAQNGNVGIGTTAPGEKLTLIGNMRVQDSEADATNKAFNLINGQYTNTNTPFLMMRGISTSAINLLTYGGGSASYNAATELRFYTAANQTTTTGNQVMRIDGSGNVGIGGNQTGGTFTGAPLYIAGTGNVGIGTTSPSKLLTVGNNNQFTVSSGGSVTGFNITANNAFCLSDCNLLFWSTAAIGDSGRAYTFADGSGSKYQQVKASSIYIATSSTAVPYLVTTSLGNVGIGTTTPDSPLTVVGRMKNTVSSAGENIAWYTGVSRPNTSGDSAVWKFYTNTAGTADFFGKVGYKFQGGTNDTSKQFQIHIADDTNPRMIINGSGNVGIGTTTPSAKLHIIGTAGATDIFSISSSTNLRLFTVGANGNVGIGTPTPVYPLSINATSSYNTGLSITGNINSFFQGNIQNTDSSIGASSDWVATANNGNDTTHYIDMGINNSGGGISPFANANEAYLYSASDSLNIGALGTGSIIKFYAGGSTTPAVTFDNVGNVAIGTTTATALLTINDPNANTEAIRILGYTGSNIVSIGQGSNKVGTLSLKSSASTKTFLTANGSSYFTGGSLGLGTSDPTANFQVAQVTAGVGSVSVGAGGTVWTGVGTEFLNTFKAGDTITSSGQTLTIQSVNSDTSLTTNAVGAAISAKAYTLSGGTRFSVLGNGNVGIGTTTPSQVLSVVGSAQFTAVGSGASANDLRITADGTLTTSASDIALKMNLMPLNVTTTGTSSLSILDKVIGLKPYTFNWKSEPDGPKDIGLIAQDVQDIFPEITFTNKVDGYMGINYSRLPVILISAIQELNNKLVKFGSYVVDGAANFVSIITDKIVANEADIKNIKTEKICLGETCIDEQSLKDILQKNSIATVLIDDGQTDGENSTSTANSTEEEIVTSTATTTDDTTIQATLIETVSEEISTSTDTEIDTEQPTDEIIESIPVVADPETI